MQNTEIVLFAYDRPEALERTIASLRIARELWKHERNATEHLPLTVALDGPRSTKDSQARVAAVHAIVSKHLPDAKVHAEATNRGLPTLLLNTLDPLVSRPEFRRAICIEDDVEVSPTLLLALETISDNIVRVFGAAKSHVVGAAPAHRDGSLEHQALLVDRGAHLASATMLRDYIERFELDGAHRDGAYGARNHDAIKAWSTELAAREHLPAPTGTSQDRMRELAWRRGNVLMRGAPMRLVRHRGLWGQHNTPWYALRTGQLFQRLDLRSWQDTEPRLREP